MAENKDSGGLPSVEWTKLLGSTEYDYASSLTTTIDRSNINDLDNYDGWTPTYNYSW
tara:strand:+ start:2295 stop:2465 length:171 start_codon:yes stop_codon:yes gene_type:complete